eukprot:1150797-Pelagomonas_calceolata.AAC.1
MRSKSREPAYKPHYDTGSVWSYRASSLHSREPAQSLALAPSMGCAPSQVLRPGNFHDQDMLGTKRHLRPGHAWNKETSMTRTCLEQRDTHDQEMLGAKRHP